MKERAPVHKIVGEERERVVEMARSGLSAKAIADALGLQRRTVQRIIYAPTPARVVKSEAAIARQLFNAYVAQGFTEDQAMALLTARGEHL